ncbi:MAG: DUF2839 domain-containing protein [Synechococcales cyanobacterium RM1_1_8]|nr:DUF2839 domain-containing protein [Synechococcales cyanobacterium RM1_1_8]
MGESKRRKETLGEDYGNQEKEYLIKGLPLTKKQSEQFIAITTQGAWYGIGLLVVAWVTIRFIGPSLGWWTLVN